MATTPRRRAAAPERPETLAEGLALHGIPVGRPPDGLRSLNPGTYTIRCPQCAHRRRGRKTPSLHVKIDPDGLGAVWSCFNAGDCAWNTPQGFRVRGAAPRDGAAPVRREYRRPPTDHARTPDQAIYEWFQGRGISRATVDACGVRVARVWMPQTQREETVIAFPYRRQGEVVNWKYRGPGKIFRQEKDAEKIFFGLDDIRGAREVVIVEGEMDKLALWECGVRACLSVPDGAPERALTADDEDPDPHDPKFSFLLNCEAELAGVERFLIATDSDGPGRVLERELGRRLGLDRCRRVQWPEGCKDANDVLLRHGPEGIAQALAAARPFPVRGVHEVASLRAQVRQLYDEGLPSGVPLGWLAFDAPGGDREARLASLRPGELVVITGAPGAGKTEWWDSVMINTARSHHWTWAVLGMETPPVRHIAGLAAKLMRKPFRRGPTERMTPEELDTALGWLDERFVFLQPEDEAPTIEWVVGTVQSVVRRYGVRGVLIDPYTEVSKDRSAAHLRDTDFAEAFLTAVRRLARVHDILVAVIAHPAKPGPNAPRVPGLYDISGSAHWNNKADLGFSVWRDRDDPDAPVEIHVKKVRFAEVGRLGVAKLRYVPRWHGYEDLPDAERPPPLLDGEAALF